MTRLPELDPEKIYHAADQWRRTQRWSWRRLAREAGMPSPSGSNTMSRLGFGRIPSAYNLTLLLVKIGRTDLREFLKDQQGA
jgi:hypothetical protein